MISPNDLSDHNKEIHSELTKKVKQLNRLKEKVIFYSSISTRQEKLGLSVSLS